MNQHKFHPANTTCKLVARKGLNEIGPLNFAEWGLFVTTTVMFQQLATPLHHFCIPSSQLQRTLRQRDPSWLYRYTLNLQGG